MPKRKVKKRLCKLFEYRYGDKDYNTLCFNHFNNSEPDSDSEYDAIRLSDYNENTINGNIFPTGTAFFHLKLESTVTECVEWAKVCPGIDYVHDFYNGIMILNKNPQLEYLDTIGVLFYYNNKNLIPFGEIIINVPDDNNCKFSLVIYDFSPDPRVRDGCFGQPNISIFNIQPFKENNLSGLLDKCYCFADDNFYKEINKFFQCYDRNFPARNMETKSACKFSIFDIHDTLTI